MAELGVEEDGYYSSTHQLSLRHVEFQVPLRYPNGNVKEADGKIGLELNGEVYVEELKSGSHWQG